MFLFFAVLSMVNPPSALGSGCPSLLVYDDNNSKLITSQYLELKVSVSDGERAHSSLGLYPQVLSCNTGSLTNVTVVWSQDEANWVVVMDTSGCDLKCCVNILLESMVTNCGPLEWTGDFLRLSEVPVLQWLARLHLNHILTLNLSSSSETFLTHLQCSPQVAVAISNGTLTYTTNWFSHLYSFSICSLAELSVSVCAHLAVTDVVLTHWSLLLLTSAGLLRSDLTSGKLIHEELAFDVQRAHFVEQGSLFCQDPIISNELIQVVTLSADAVLIYSTQPPHMNWTLQTTLCSGGCGQTLVAYDHQREEFITAATGNDSIAHTSSGQLLGNVSLSHIFYHSTASAVYLLGSQVWLSVDGGATFNSLLSLPSPVISYSYNNHWLLLLTASGQLYGSFPGEHTITPLTPTLSHTLTRIALSGPSTFRMIDLNNKTSVVIKISAERVGPCLLSFDIIDSLLIYLHGNLSECAVGDLIGYTANILSLGTGLIVNSFGQDALLAMTTPVSSSGAGVGEWSFSQKYCWSRLIPMAGLNRVTHEMDILESVELQVMATSTFGQKLLRHFLDVTVTLGNPELFVYAVQSQHTPTTHTLTATIQQRNTSTHPVYSSVRFQLAYCSTLCETCSLTSLILTSCPRGKQLQFVYPQPIEQLYNLPVNYRPPSSRGEAVHSSPHVYNADPSTFIQSAFSEVDAQLKQCGNKSTRAQCECSQSQSTSNDIEYSDCIKAIHRHSYETEFLLNFTLLLGNGKQQNTFADQLKELNGRSDYTLLTNNTRLTAIRFQGPGLFHFRGMMVNSTSFCQLSTQFLVFVDYTPLPKAGELTVTTLTTVVFGLLTFTAYLINYLQQRKNISLLNKHY